MLLDGDGEPADHVFADAVLPLELCDHAARTLDVEHHEVGLAVAVNLVGEALEAPGLGLDDLPAVFRQDIRGVFRERIDLGLSQVLTREENMLVQRHDSFSSLADC